VNPKWNCHKPDYSLRRVIITYTPLAFNSHSDSWQ